MLSRNWIWPTLAIADAVFGLGLKPRYNSTESIAAVPPAVSLSSSPIPVENGDEENRVRYTETEVSVDTHCHGCTPETVTVTCWETTTEYQPTTIISTVYNLTETTKTKYIIKTSVDYETETYTETETTLSISPTTTTTSTSSTTTTTTTETEISISVSTSISPTTTSTSSTTTTTTTETDTATTSVSTTTTTTETDTTTTSTSSTTTTTETDTTTTTTSTSSTTTTTETITTSTSSTTTTTETDTQLITTTIVSISIQPPVTVTSTEDGTTVTTVLPGTTVSQTFLTTIVQPPVTVTGPGETITAPGITVTGPGATVTLAPSVSTMTTTQLTTSFSFITEVVTCPAPTPTGAVEPLDPSSELTWGCKPGFVCNPEKPGDCNIWADAPVPEYRCKKSDCIPAPRYEATTWVGNDTGYFAPNNAYFNLAPVAFGLSYDVFEIDYYTIKVGKHSYTTISTGNWESLTSLTSFDTTMLTGTAVGTFDASDPVPTLTADYRLNPHKRAKEQQQSTSHPRFANRELSHLSKRGGEPVPAVCYDTCNNCFLEAQMVGKVPTLCEEGSAFRGYYDACNECIDNWSEDSEKYDVVKREYLEPVFEQWISYCEVGLGIDLKEEVQEQNNNLTEDRDEDDDAGTLTTTADMTSTTSTATTTSAMPASTSSATLTTTTSPTEPESSDVSDSETSSVLGIGGSSSSETSDVLPTTMTSPPMSLGTTATPPTGNGTTTTSVEVVTAAGVPRMAWLSSCGAAVFVPTLVTFLLGA